jgi:hypothetical protein
VRLVSLANLEAEASEFALPLPDDVLPKLQAGSSLARIGMPAVRPAAISARPAQAPAHSPEVTAAGVDAEGNAHHRLHPCFAGKKLGDLVVVRDQYAIG